MLYTVMKDGKALKELKTLVAAKKLAEAEKAQVLCEGKVVYTAATTVPDEEAAASIAEEPSTEKAGAEAVAYRLTHLMNVRSAPSMEAQKVGVLPAGTVVHVASIDSDWMHLVDGTFILYQGGTFAEKAD
jgi:hypothetical protein